jgi:hypothetical protein
MKILIIVFLLVILSILLIKCYETENFVADLNRNKDCCVIRKIRDGPKFSYTYKPSSYCDNYHDNYLRTIKVGESLGDRAFTMDDCKENKNKPMFGSCRTLGGFNCVDFITEKDCKKYPDLTWDKKTCNERLDIEINYYKYSVKRIKTYTLS